MNGLLRSGHGMIAFVLVVASVVVLGALAPGSWATPSQQGQSTLPTPPPPTATSVPPTATSVPPTATSVPPTATAVPPTNTPWPQWPTATPVPTATVFRPAPATGGQPILGAPIILWEAGLGLVVIGLGLAWRRRR